MQSAHSAFRSMPDDSSLYFGVVQAIPLARPHFDELWVFIDFAVARDDPAHGEFTGPV